MKINIVITLLSILTFSAKAQIEGNSYTSVSVTQVTVEINYLEEFSNFNWNEVKELLNGNKPDKEVSLALEYKASNEQNTKENKVKNFTFKLSGKYSDLGDLISTLQKTIGMMVKIDSQELN